MRATLPVSGASADTIMVILPNMSWSSCRDHYGQSAEGLPLAQPGRLACACRRRIREEPSMADADDVRRLALGLPGVEEIDSDGFDFRVGGRGFVWSYPERTPGQRRVIRTDIAVLFTGDEAEKQALLLGEPRVFFTTSGYDGWPLR